jgi:hypothetical protein
MRVISGCSQTASAVSQHRVELVQLLHARERDQEPLTPRLRSASALQSLELAQQVLALREELV